MSADAYILALNSLEADRTRAPGRPGLGLSHVDFLRILRVARRICERYGGAEPAMAALHELVARRHESGSRDRYLRLVQIAVAVRERYRRQCAECGEGRTP